jgi:hypothetical protein
LNIFGVGDGFGFEREPVAVFGYPSQAVNLPSAVGFLVMVRVA